MLFNNIKALAKEKKIPIVKIEESCELARGSICKWNDVSPAVDKVKKVAQILDVSIEKLLEESTDTN